MILETNAQLGVQLTPNVMLAITVLIPPGLQASVILPITVQLVHLNTTYVLKALTVQLLAQHRYALQAPIALKVPSLLSRVTLEITVQKELLSKQTADKAITVPVPLKKFNAKKGIGVLQV